MQTLAHSGQNKLILALVLKEWVSILAAFQMSEETLFLESLHRDDFNDAWNSMIT